MTRFRESEKSLHKGSKAQTRAMYVEAVLLDLFRSMLLETLLEYKAFFPNATGVLSPDKHSECRHSVALLSPETDALDILTTQYHNMEDKQEHAGTLPSPMHLPP
ncbi:Hypothetical predicted protein [Xyrichtys novacula]|uniref:Uncharacterized protein n=1 Tax=Xyrichtys novacula TaxID=13765 RepID=A0AAV1H029_XYRNO|nr:Hypothetical predicted protein [Xyrichtys novacula]